MKQNEMERKVATLVQGRTKTKCLKKKVETLRYIKTGEENWKGRKKMWNVIISENQPVTINLLVPMRWFGGEEKL